MDRPVGFRTVANQGRLVVDRPAAKGRYGRGAYGVLVDGAKRGEVGNGEAFELRLSAGNYTVQVGTVAYSRPKPHPVYGSPALSIEIADDTSTQIRVVPSGVPFFRHSRSPESMLTLHVEGGPGDGPIVRSTEIPGQVTRPQPGSLARRRLLTRDLIDKPHPLRSWQAAVSAFAFLFAVSAVLSAIFSSHRSIGGRAFTIVLFGLAAVLIFLEWGSLVRGRRSQPKTPY